MHVWARKALYYTDRWPFTRTLLRYSTGYRTRLVDLRLITMIGGLSLENPLLVGPGWDKVGEAIGGLYELGFAGVEIGSVPEHPQKGNPKPRQFMIESGVALNRLGFNSPGMEQVYRNLVKCRRPAGAVVGVSIGMNKDVPHDKAPYAHAVVARCLYHLAHYFVINVSSPNTPGLRKLQDKGPLIDIVRAVNAEIKTRSNYGGKPLWVKIAPDLTLEALDDVTEVVLENQLAGIIAANTTINPDIKAKYGLRWMSEPGGLSGDDEDFRYLSNTQIAHIYKQTSGKLDIIGVGGVKDTRTALEKILAGARAVQIVTAIRGEGPGVAERIKRGLIAFMEKEGVKNIQALVGQRVALPLGKEKTMEVPMK